MRSGRTATLVTPSSPRRPNGPTSTRSLAPRWREGSTGDTMHGMLALAAFLIAVQQVPDTFVTAPSGRPPSTARQRADYTITARLDEEAQKLVASGEMKYVNMSRDTLREMYVHQYLNAFRPGSQWSEVDEREGRVRFQKLKDPNYGYERFTRAPEVDGVPVKVDWPGAPDSTVAHFKLPHPIAPGDSAVVSFAWEARASTVPRRQAHRGRSWDFSQWYPKVAVYDNGGWEPYALRPAGEFYGEFGTFDVTLILRADQVVAGTGLVVSGDPGWARVKQWGEIVQPSLAPYHIRELPAPTLGAGEKAVRFHGENIHEFAWTTSPDYRYEGGAYVRARNEVPAPDGVTTWDTVAVNVLYRPGDENSWGKGGAVTRTKIALDWLEHVYGPYAYPQMVNVHRIDGGGTEFPMMMMNGSSSQGLILHEGGHVFTFGSLANNEWRSGWMDEGLTSYQTSWAEGVTPQDRAHRGGRDSVVIRPKGYRRFAPRPQGADALQLTQYRLEFLGRAQPVGTQSDRFSEFGIYNDMIYSRAELMYGALRDALGDNAFVAFMHRYYADWALQHVDERAMRGSAELASGDSLRWFFDQWLRHTGATDYALGKVTIAQQYDGSWLTRGRVSRMNEYRERPPLGVLTSAGWTIARGDPMADDQWIEVRTTGKPEAVRLDPLRTTEDWNRRNDVRSPLSSFFLSAERVRRNVFDWPFLDQVSRDQTINAWTPIGWYSAPNGLVGGLRLRSSYQGLVDRNELGVVVNRDIPGARSSPGVPPSLQAWWIHENPTLNGRPLIGLRTALWTFDGAKGGEISYQWDASPYIYARTITTNRSIGATFTAPRRFGYLPDRWESAHVYELQLAQTSKFWRLPWKPLLSANIGIGGVKRPELPESLLAPFGGTWGDQGGYARWEASVAGLRATGSDSVRVLSLRLYTSGSTSLTPLQRRPFLASRDPYETLYNHFVRPTGGILTRKYVRTVPLGGAGLRGYDPAFATRSSTIALNAEEGARLLALSSGSRPLAIWGTAFVDVAALQHDYPGDAGVGVMLRGWVFDRDVRVRVDLPIWVADPALAAGATTGNGLPARKAVRFDRVQLTLGSFW
ncbi:MAG: M1 family metallopeptidase [Gemmatimonadaceae bacterium]